MKRPLYITTVLTMLLTTLTLLSPYRLQGQSSSEQNKAEVIVDPSNKQNITGYVNICYSYSDRTLRTIDIRRGLINLKEAMLKWTGIEARLDNPLPISSPKIMKMPFIYLAFAQGLDLTTPEKDNLRKYLLSGGFLFIENINAALDVNFADSRFMKIFNGIISGEGRFAPIYNNDPIYHSFFDFPDGPPRGDETRMVEVRSLEGLYIEGRLAAVFSNKRYVNKWMQDTNNDPQLKMGVNLLVFALTQHGGLAKVTR